MQTVIIVIHLMIVIAMIAVILLQRSEGGGLGIGGGGGGGAGGGMFSARGSANLLTRTTTFLAVAFFVTSLGLGILARQQAGAPSILDGLTNTGADTPLGDTETRGSGTGILDALQPADGAVTPPTGDNATPDAPSAPAAPASPQVPTGQ